MVQARWTWSERGRVFANQLNHDLAPPAICRRVIERARLAIDRARRNLDVVGKNEWSTAGALSKFGGRLFKRVLTSGAVSNLDRSAKDGHVPSVPYPTTVETR